MPPKSKVFGSDRKRFAGKSKPVRTGDEKPCLVGNPHEVAQRLIVKNIRVSEEKGTDPRRTNPLSVVSSDFDPEDYDSEYMRDHFPTLNDMTGMVYCKLLRSGLYREHASEIIGFSVTAVKGWQRRGRKRIAEITKWIEDAESLALEGNDVEAITAELGTRPEIDTHARFASASGKSYAKGEQSLFSVIWDAALDGEVGCCMWLLERRDPRRYGKAAARSADKEHDPIGDSEHVDAVAEFDALVSEFLERRRKTVVSQEARGE